jgi:hypothetical protein
MSHAVISNAFIPSGPYCYEPLGLSLDESGRPVLKTRPCSFYVRGPSGAKCDHLNVEQDALLDDGCKICGINEPDYL